MHQQFWSLGIVCLEMNGKVVLAIHACMHHEFRGLNIGTLPWIKSHGAYGEFRGATSFDHLKIGRLLEAKDTVSSVSYFDLDGPIFTQFDVSHVNVLLVDGNSWSPTTIIRAGFRREEYGSCNKCNYHHDDYPGKLFLLPLLLCLLAHETSLFNLPSMEFVADETDHNQ